MNAQERPRQTQPFGAEAVSSSSWAAFISYAHAADKKLAVALQLGLQQFAKPWTRLRAIDVFRDDTDLGATPHLWKDILRALRSSRYFILLASPGAAKSTWVSKECLSWLDHGGSDRFLVVLTDGAALWNDAECDWDWSHTTAIPESLRGKIRSEPLIVDLRPSAFAAPSLRDPGFRDAVARLAATIRGIPKSLLIGTDVEQHAKLTRAKRIAIAGLITLTATSATAAVHAFIQSSRATENLEKTQIEESRLLALSSRQATDSGDSLTGITLALEGLPHPKHPERPYVRESELALAHALYNQRYARLLLGPMGIILDYDVHPRDRIVAASDTNRALVVWNADTAEIMLNAKLRDRADILRFSPRGDRILAVSNTGQIRLLAWPGGQVVGNWSAGADMKPSVARFDRVGDQFAIGTENGEVLLWRAKSTEPIVMRRPSVSEVTDVDFAPDGAFLATSWTDGTVHLANLRNPAASRMLMAREEELKSARFSPDGQLIAITSGSRVQLLSLQSGRILRTLTPTGGSITCSQFAPDSKALIVSDAHAGAWSWPVDAASPSDRLTVKGDSAWCASFSRTGELIALPSTQGSISVWRYATGGRIGEAHLHNGPVFGVHFLGDSSRIVSVSQGPEVIVWDAHAHSALQYVKNGTDEIEEFAIDGKSRYVLALGKDNSVYVWPLNFSIQRGTDVKFAASFSKPLRVGSADVPGWSGATAIAIAESADLFATAHLGGIVQVRNFVTRSRVTLDMQNAQEPPLPKADYSDFARDLAFTPAGDKLIVGTFAGSVTLWDPATGKVTARLRQPDKRVVNRVALSPNGRYAAAAIDSDLYIYDALTGHQISELQGGKRSRYYVHFSSDSRHLVSGGPNQGYDLTTLSDTITHDRRSTPNIVQNANFDPSGRYLVTASWDNTASIESVSDPDDSRRLEGHTFWVRHAEFGRDGSLVVTGADDATVRLWDVQSGIEIAAFGHSSDIEQAEITPNGNMLVTLTKNGELSVVGVLPSGKALWAAGVAARGAFIPSAEARKWLRDIGGETYREKLPRRTTQGAQSGAGFAR